MYNNLDFSEINPAVEVLVVDTESRHETGREAASRVREVAHKAVDADVQYFYKKTDSVLRGNIGSELGALMDATRQKELMYAPAYPDAKRSTVKGCQFVDGIPIDKTGFTEDPLDPVTSCYIPDIIKTQADITVVLVAKNKRADYEIDRDEKKIYVFDAETNEDLKAVAGWLKENRKIRLTAGCAGFANVLREVLNLEKGEKPGFHWIKGNMLAICGSLNEFSLKQVDYAGKNNFKVINLKPVEKMDENYYNSRESAGLVQRIADLMENGHEVIVTTVDETSGGTKDLARSLGIKEHEIPLMIVRNVGELVTKVIEQTPLGTLVVFGGDTAGEIVRRMAFHRVVPRNEIVTGVVVSTATGANNVNLITKSGGFGEEDVLVKIKRYKDAMET